MIVSHEWLKQFVPHDMSPEEVGNMISRHTVTLDGIESAGADLSAFVIGRVVWREKHPNSDKLSVTKVDDGSGELLDVVCGAQNIVVGAKYPFARTGTLMPAGITIEKRKIRGETSNGMLCSARELMLGDDHDGILELKTDAEPGTPLLQVLSAGDSRLNLDVLPNRPDLLSHRGVARELSAISGKPLVVLPLEGMVADLSQPHGVIEGSANPTANVTGVASASTNGVHVTIEDPASCSQYLAVVIRGVKVGESPAWLKQRLDSIGVRSISNVVDFTNYVLHGYGQPIHAFDLGKLAGSGIVVRPTRAGESLVTLDGVERKIETGTTVICDGERPVALAGVMGGRDSEVTDTTTDLLIEIASFNPKFVRKVRRMVGLNTDASYRFERGTDEEALEEIAALTLFMLPKIAGGVAESLIYVGAERVAAKPVAVRASRVSHLVGVDVPLAESKKHLESIGCAVQVNFSSENGAAASESDANAVMHVTAPSWRNDLGLEVDFIEEVARLKGFDVLPDELRATRPGNVPDHPLYLVGRRVRDALVTAGLAETRPMPFTKTGDESLRVRNPLAEDEPYLRQSIVETLARRAEYNLARMQGNIRLFEVGNAFVASKDRLPREEMRAGALIMGMRRPPHFTEPNPPAFDAWDAKALAETMIDSAFPRGTAVLESGDDDVLWQIKSRTGTVIGRVVRVELDKPVWASDAFGVELLLGLMPSADVAAARQNAHGSYVAPLPDALEDAKAAGVAGSTHAKYKAIPTTPAVGIDLALVVPDSTSASDVEKVLRTTGGDLLESVALFDEFRGTGVSEGSRSLAFHLTFRHPERTLKEKEIEGRRMALLEKLNKELGIKPRAS